MKEKCYKLKAKFCYTLAVIFFILSLSLILVGCDTDSFELETKIDPETTIVSGIIAVEYKLGDLLILDEWEDLNVAETLYLTNKKKVKEIHLKVTAGSFVGVVFNYTINASITIQTNPVEWKVLHENVDSLPNVIWKTKDGKDIAEKSQKDDDLKVMDNNQTGKTLRKLK